MNNWSRNGWPMNNRAMNNRAMNDWPTDNWSTDDRCGVWGRPSGGSSGWPVLVSLGHGQGRQRERKYRRNRRKASHGVSFLECSRRRHQHRIALYGIEVSPPMSHLSLRTAAPLFPFLTQEQTSGSALAVSLKGYERPRATAAKSPYSMTLSASAAGR
jgi:hypothetical protein